MTRWPHPTGPRRLFFATVIPACLFSLAAARIASAQPVSEPAAVPAGETAPAQVPIDYESPRTTMRTFLDAAGKLADGGDDKETQEKAFAALQLPETLGTARRQYVLDLWDVLNHITRINLAAMLPDREEAGELSRFEFFPGNSYKQAAAQFGGVLQEAGDPPAPILLVKTETGAWKFSAETLNNLQYLVSWCRPLHRKAGSDITARSPARWLRDQMPPLLKDRFFLTLELWQWLGLFAIILLAVIVDLASRLALRGVVRRAARRYLGEPDEDNVRMTVRPIAIAIGAGVFLILLNALGITGMGHTVLLVAARVLVIVSAAWAAWAATDLVAMVLLDKAKATESTFDDMAIPLLRKTTKLFVVAMGLIYVADTFQIALAPLLGGLGLAGLAVSFAAQDIVKNLFGGVTIFLDRPFKIGERIKFQGHDGVIEEIGFRTTRLRTLTGHLVTIPNGSITNESVENVGRRPYIRRVMDVTITYDTPREKIQQAVEIIRGILDEDGIREPIHPVVNGNELPPRVYFNDYNAASLNIFVIYWFAPPVYWDYMDHAQRLNMRLFEEYERAGIEFAFPTQTLYLAGDPNRELAVKMLGAAP